MTSTTPPCSPRASGRRRQKTWSDSSRAGAGARGGGGAIAAESKSEASTLTGTSSSSSSPKESRPSTAAPTSTARMALSSTGAAAPPSWIEPRRVGIFFSFSVVCFLARAACGRGRLRVGVVAARGALLRRGAALLRRAQQQLVFSGFRTKTHRLASHHRRDTLL